MNDDKNSRGERICREVLESYYKKKFPRVRPYFLQNPETGRNLELDCYNAELKIGLEYNGIQHYIWPNFTNCTKEEFMEQLRRDQFKYQICEQNDIYLITVPYTVPYELIPNYIFYYLPENVAQRSSKHKNTKTPI